MNLVIFQTIEEKKKLTLFNPKIYFIQTSFELCLGQGHQGGLLFMIGFKKILGFWEMGSSNY